MISVVDIAQPVFDRTARGSVSATERAWEKACLELGVELVHGDSPLRSAVSGVVSGHEISISLVGGMKSEKGVRTQYSIRFDTPHAPPFSLVKRDDKREYLSVDTGNPYFDDVVAVETTDRPAVTRFLADDRRALVLNVLLQWPEARVTNHHAHVWTEGVAERPEDVIRSVRRLVELADSFAPSWVEVSLDERSVLDDLFNASRDMAGIADRFENLYRGSGVQWTGEVLQVGAVDKAGQRVAVFVGTAKGHDAGSGRVVALTAIDPDLPVARGDVVTFEGALLNLDAKKRLFRIEG